MSTRVQIAHRCLVWLALLFLAATSAPPPAPSQQQQQQQLQSSLSFPAAVVCLEGTTCTVPITLNLEAPVDAFGNGDASVLAILEAVVSSTSMSALSAVSSTGLVRLLLGLSLSPIQAGPNISSTTSSSSDSSAGGLLFLTSSPSSRLSVLKGSMEGAETYSLAGTFGAIRQVLRAVQYQAGPDAWRNTAVPTAAAATSSSSSGGNGVPGSASVSVPLYVSVATQVLEMGVWVPVSTANASVSVSVARRNRPPVITLLSSSAPASVNINTTLVCRQGQTANFAFSVNDDDYSLSSVTFAATTPDGPSTASVPPMTASLKCLFGSIALPLAPGDGGGGGSVTCSNSTSTGTTCLLAGPPSFLNRVLAVVAYTPLPGYTWIDGLEKLTLSLTDAGSYWNTGNSAPDPVTAQQQSTTLTLRVDPVNQPPSLHLTTASVSIAELGVVSVGGLLGGRGDIEEAVANGALDGLVAGVSSSELAGVSLSDAAVASTTASVVIAVSDANPGDTLTLTLTSMGRFILSTDPGIAQVLTQSLSGAPAGSAASAAVPTKFHQTNLLLQRQHRQRFLYSSLFALAANANTSSSGGSSSSSIRSVVNADNSASFSISGPFQYVNQVLDRLLLLPAPALGIGINEISVSVRDGGGASTSGSIEVVVLPQTQLPSLAFPFAAATCAEDGVAAISNVSISTNAIVNAASSASANANVSSSIYDLVMVNATALANGRLFLPSPTLLTNVKFSTSAGPSADYTLVSGSFNANLTSLCVLGYRGAVELLLQALLFYPSPHFYTSNSFAGSIIVANNKALVLFSVDLYSAITGPANVATALALEVFVSSVNDAPVLVLPFEAFLYEGCRAAILANATLSDVDGAVDIATGAIVDMVQLNVTATFGSLLVPSVNINAYAGNTKIVFVNASSLTLTGPLREVSLALGHLVYDPPANYNGNDFVWVSVGDELVLSAGSGGGVYVTSAAPPRELLVIVMPVNRPPVISAPSVLQYPGFEQGSVTSGGGGLPVPGVSISDADFSSNYVATNLLTVSLSVDTGAKLSLSSTEVYFVHGTSGGAADGLVISGPLGSVNHALSSLQILPSSNPVNVNTRPRYVATVNITATDGGHFGAPPSACVCVDSDCASYKAYPLEPARLPALPLSDSVAISVVVSPS